MGNIFSSKRNLEFFFCLVSEYPFPQPIRQSWSDLMVDKSLCAFPQNK